MVDEMHCVTVSEWKSVHKRLDDLENIVRELKSKSEIFGDGNHNLNSNLEIQNSVESGRAELNTQLVISTGPDMNVNLSGPVSIDQEVQEESLASEENISGLESAPSRSCMLASGSPVASTSGTMTVKLIHAQVPSASSSSSCFENGIGIHDQNAFEKSRRAIISIKRCDETEVLPRRHSIGLKNTKQNKKTGSTSNTVKRIRPPKVPRKPVVSASESIYGKCNGSPVPVLGKQKQHKCLICKRKFTTKYYLSDHARVHTGEKPYTCHVCSKRFTQKSQLNVHLRVHTRERPFTCQFCSKAFKSNGELNIHLIVHTGEKPYQCHFCSKYFSRRSDLTSHIRVHTGEKPYNCKYCPKTYRRPAHLKSHLRTHKNSAL